MIDKTYRPNIYTLVLLIIISLIYNIVCYYKFTDSFIFVDSKVINNSYSNNFTIFRKSITSAKEKYVEGFSYPNPQLCPDWGKKLKVVIMVISKPSHYDIRMKIRRTWGQKRSDIAVVFLMGKTNDRRIETLLEAEKLACGDMVFAHFKENYRNLTLKSMSVIHWVSKYCRDADFLLKVDDDVYVNIPRLLEVLYELNVKRKVLYGKVVRQRKVTRRNGTRYFVSLEEYPMEEFPRYLIGPCYLFPASLASVIYYASLIQPFNPMEDVFITGLVAKNLNFKIVNTPGILNDISEEEGFCAVFKMIALDKDKFIYYYKACKEWFQKRS